MEPSIEYSPHCGAFHCKSGMCHVIRVECISCHLPSATTLNGKYLMIKWKYYFYY